MLFFGFNDAPAACYQLGFGEGSCVLIGMSDLQPEKPAIAGA